MSVSDIDYYVKSCTTCQQVNKKPAASLHPIISADSPWHRIGIDLIDPQDQEIHT